MPCCLVALLALLGPRIVLVLLWLFDRPFFKGLADGLLVQALGVIFLPWTLLAYAASVNFFPGGAFAGLSLLGVILTVIGLLLDLGSYGGGYRGRSYRR